eukprot:m.710059 g.710059  ORF g.710059 m.710059 type:complete len:879 (-) comp58755_c0_seq4:130-2766(-)
MAYQLALVVLAMVIMAILGVTIYWLTSDEYRVRKKKIELGYPVKPWWYFPSLVFGFILGPILRKKWEKEHVFYRTDDYGAPDPDWRDLKKRRGSKLTESKSSTALPLSRAVIWQDLPRGDGKLRRDLVNSVVAKVQVAVTDSLFNAALDEAITMFLSDMNADASARARMEKMRARAEDLAAQDSHQKAEERRIREQQEREKAEAKAAADLVAHNKAKLEHKKSTIATAKLTGQLALIRQLEAESSESDSDEVLPSNIVLHDRAHRKSLGVIVGLGNQSRPQSMATEPFEVIRRISITPGSATAITRFDHSAELSFTGLKVLVAEEDLTNLRKEFKSVPLNKPAMAEPGTEQFNRNIKALPNLHTRVRLNEVGGDPLSTYINANFIRGEAGELDKYIVTQAPMDGQEVQKKSTLNAFWRMVADNHCRVIVMLAELNPQQCSKYWPLHEKTSQLYGALKVSNIGVASGSGYIITHLELEDPFVKDSTRELLHYQFYSWKGEEPPENCAPFLDLVDAVLLAQGKSPSPIVVHDDFGLGRSGVFIAVVNGLWQAKHNHSVDVLSCLAHLREDRGGLIETVQQYFFVHKCINWSLTRKSAAPPAYTRAPDSSIQLRITRGDSTSDAAALALALDGEAANDDLSTAQIEQKKATLKALEYGEPVHRRAEPGPSGPPPYSAPPQPTGSPGIGRKATEKNPPVDPPKPSRSQAISSDIVASVSPPPPSHHDRHPQGRAPPSHSPTQSPLLARKMPPPSAMQDPGSASRSSPAPRRHQYDADLAPVPDPSEPTLAPHKAGGRYDVDLAPAPDPSSNRGHRDPKYAGADLSPAPSPSRGSPAAARAGPDRYRNTDLAPAPAPITVLDFFSSEQPTGFDDSLLEPAPDP